MRVRLHPALLLAAFACGEEPPDATPTHPTTGPSPAVSPLQPLPIPDPPEGGTYVPEGYVPDALSHVVIVGDSVTVGTLLEHDKDRWAKLLIDQCPDCYPFDDGDLTDRYGSVDVLDLSEPGMSVTELILWHLIKIENTFGSPVEGGVLIIGTLGLGDIIFGGARPAAEELYINNLRLLNDYFKDPEIFPDGAWFYLVNIYDPTDGVGHYPYCYQGQDMSPLYNATDSANIASRALAVEQGWAWIDARGHFLGHGHQYDNPMAPYYIPDAPFWFIDCLHPNIEGHHEIRRIALAALDGEPL